MPKSHTVAQGETLTRIARQYKYSSWKKIYEHPDNEEFRALRSDPDIIYPGDQIIIPDIEPKKMSARSGKSHTFCVKREIEIFKVKISNGAGSAWEGKRVAIEIGGQTIVTMLPKDGLLEIPLPQGNESDATLKIFLDDNSDIPSHQFDILLAHLDPVEELSGVQARCNLLGHDCGVTDGIMGQKTREGVKSFQAEYDLDIDGEPGPITKAKLKEVYGS